MRESAAENDCRVGSWGGGPNTDFERTEGPSPQVNSMPASWSELRGILGKKGKNPGKKRKREKEKGEGEAGRRLPRIIGIVTQRRQHRLPIPPPTSIHAAPCNHHYSHATIHQLPHLLPPNHSPESINRPYLTSTQKPDEFLFL